MQLRDVQQAALNDSVASFKKGGSFHLLQAPVGWGKTIFSSALMEWAKNEHDAHCLFIAHRRELIVQTEEKINLVAPEIKTGVMMGTRKEVAQVTIGTHQTISKNLEMFDKINLIIVDEVHTISQSTWGIIDHFIMLNPRLRVLGVTGTPFNSREGYIYGAGKRWDEPFYSTSIDEMIAKGYLSPFRYKMTESMEDELKGVAIKGKDFDEDSLSDLMSEEQHMGTVKTAIAEHAQGRTRIMVFAVNIDHAEKLASFLGCHAVHSKLNKKIWRKRVDEFKEGKTRILVNVSQLSVGFDCPEVDCVVLARPTMATDLFVQICGRGLRVSEGKTDCMFLDLVGNYLRHSLPSTPRVRDPREKEERDELKEKELPANVCPDCFDVVDVALKNCPNCGAEMALRALVKEMNARARMVEIETEANKPKVVRFGAKKAVTSMGNHGTRFWIVISPKEKPLFNFCGEGTKQEAKWTERFKEINIGDSVKIVENYRGRGHWIA